MRSIAPPLSARTAIGTLACPVMMMIGGVTRGCARETDNGWEAGGCPQPARGGACERPPSRLLVAGQSPDGECRPHHTARRDAGLLRRHHRTAAAEDPGRADPGDSARRD